MLLDPLSAVMLCVVTGVGFLIHVYSTGYMAHEGGYYRFFGYLNLFMFSMLTLVLANNLLLLFVGWEGVGLCSYLLIGFYFLRKSASDAGKKAFIVNRIGDAGFILGLFLLLGTLGTLRFTEIGPAIERGRIRGGQRRDDRDRAAAVRGRDRQIGADSAVRLAAGRHGRAHAGERADSRGHDGDRGRVHDHAHERRLPAGARWPWPWWPRSARSRRSIAATMGLVQNDIKRVLAYSTVSQLGYMFLALGVGAFTAGIFHLMTHAFFKALLFLGSGSVIHAMSGEQDMRKMGALWSKIPTTAWTFLVATIAISGIPPLAGFVSKDAILGGCVRRAAAAVGHRLHHRGHDGVLHVPPGEHDVLRRVARAARSGAPHSRIAAVDDRAADDSGGAFDRGRMDWLAGIAGRQRSLRAISWIR